MTSTHAQINGLGASFRTSRHAITNARDDLVSFQTVLSKQEKELG